jgi:CheY-like chemotaxis protein/DNA-directed RNA polymerase subunit RPC12/RpoP
MIIKCEKCEKKFKIPDEKVPKGKIVSQTCPGCDHKIIIDIRMDTPPTSEKTPDLSATANLEEDVINEVEFDAYDATDRPFDFVEEGVETALLCEPDSTSRKKIKTALENLGYHTTEAHSTKDVIKQMRFHVFDLVVVNERFGTQNPDMNNVLKYLDRLNISIRRSIFVALITDRFRTMDHMVAYNRSVNLTVNSKNIDDIEKIIRRGISDRDSLYRVLNESLVKAGRV